MSRAGLGGAPSGAMVVRQPAARVRRRPARVRAVPRDHPVAVLTAPRRPPHRVLRMPADTPANAPMVIAVLQPLPLAPHRDAHRTPPRAPRRRRRAPVFARAVTAHRRLRLLGPTHGHTPSWMRQPIRIAHERQDHMHRLFSTRLSAQTEYRKEGVPKRYSWQDSRCSSRLALLMCFLQQRTTAFSLPSHVIRDDLSS